MSVEVFSLDLIPVCKREIETGAEKMRSTIDPPSTVHPHTISMSTRDTRTSVNTLCDQEEKV